MAQYLTDLGIADYKIIQDTDDYAFSQDSVFLANMAKIGTNDEVLDLGCGSGILATLALIKKGAKHAVGIDVREDVCEMAKKSAEMNRLSLDIICGDIKNIRSLIKAESFDKILCNPPYFANAKATSSKGLSRLETTATLDDFVGAASYSLKFGGHLWIVQKAANLAKLCASLDAHNLAAKHIVFIYPKLSSGIDVVVIDAKKGGKDGLTTSTFIAQNEDGSFTSEYQKLYS